MLLCARYKNKIKKNKLSNEAWIKIWICPFGGDPNLQSNWKGVHWIEPVELYLEPLMLLLEPVVERIATGFSKIFWVLARICQFLGLWSILWHFEDGHSIERIELYLEPVSR